VVSDRVLELIAGLAAVVFIAAMVWTDFFSSDIPRRSETVRQIQYAAALIVLTCVIVLGVRDR
jgi:hypothetical protein